MIVTKVTTHLSTNTPTLSSSTAQPTTSSKPFSTSELSSPATETDDTTWPDEMTTELMNTATERETTTKASTLGGKTTTMLESTLTIVTMIAKPTIIFSGNVE